MDSPAFCLTPRLDQKTGLPESGLTDDQHL
jgi:hypothetical protein